MSVLEQAACALREMTAGEARTDTLERILASLDDEDLLDEAAHALRTHTARAGDRTLARIHRTLDGARPTIASTERSEAERGVAINRGIWGGSPPRMIVRRRATRGAAAAAAAIVVAIAVPSAWAWTSGAAHTFFSHAQRSQEKSFEVQPVDRIPARRAAAPLAPPAAPAAIDPPSRPPARDVESRLFARAHRAHVERTDPAVSVAAYDSYLARYPRGRYEPEARYGRALDLIRLGRREEARAALERFANGEHHGYRRAEAARLIDALDAQSFDSVSP